GGYYGNALEAATSGAHDCFVEQNPKELNHSDADRREYSRSLQSTVSARSEPIVKLLLSRGAVRTDPHQSPKSPT
ncbi:hypothetical protein V492_08029, partial [Pseudogymnoascus sp. VKM F-4246]